MPTTTYGNITDVTQIQVDEKSSEISSVMQNNQTRNPVAYDEIQKSLLPLHAPERKKILANDSRDLSVFFMIGIAINIIMASTFAWWFTKEWRKSKNRDYP